MFNGILLFLALLVTWIVFSGHISPFFILAGLISCAIALYFAQRMDVIDRRAYPLYLKLKAPLYLLLLLKEILFSALKVSQRVWHVNPRISPVLGWVRTRQKSDVGKALYANSITLTPGTVCINVEGDLLEVHSLSKRGLDDLHDGFMDEVIEETVT